MAGSFQINTLEIVWFRHAFFKIKTPKLIIYTDPFEVESDFPGDIILVSHEHYDHCDKDSIEKLKKAGTVIFAPASCANDISAKIIQAGEEVEERGIKIKAVLAYNIGKDFHPKEKGGLGFVIEAEGTKIYFAGDTDRIPEMAKLGEIDIALLPIGGTYTMNEQEAAEAVKIIKPRIVAPMHYGTLGDTPGNPYGFKELVKDITDVRILE